MLYLIKIRIRIRISTKGGIQIRIKSFWIPKVFLLSRFLLCRLHWSAFYLALSQRNLTFRDITWTVAGKMWYNTECFMPYHVFLYISYYIAEFFIAFLTVWCPSLIVAFNAFFCNSHIETLQLFGFLNLLKFGTFTNIDISKIKKIPVHFFCK